MKVVLIANYQVEYAAALAGALSPLHDVTFLVWDRHARILNGADMRDVAVRRLPSPRPGRPWNLRDGGRILRALHRERPDVVHVQNPYTWHAPWAPLLGQFPLVLTVHDPLPHLGTVQPHWKPVFRWTLRWTDAAIVHGDAMKVLLRDTYAVPGERVHVIPHGLFQQYAAPEAPAERAGDVLYFGRILPHKGLDVLLKADPLIREHHPVYRLTVVGEGDLSPYEALVPRSPHVRVVNRFVTLEEAAGYLQSARLVVLPYVDASQSGVAAAAFATETPVVATTVGSLPEVVRDGVTGLLVPPRDPRALADAIVRVLGDDGLRRRLVEGVRAASADLSWDRVAERTSAVYEAVR